MYGLCFEAKTFQWDINFINVKTAFLNENLKEILYMAISEVGGNQEDKVFNKLVKSLYVLKQLPRSWTDLTWGLQDRNMISVYIQKEKEIYIFHSLC